MKRILFVAGLAAGLAAAAPAKEGVVQCANLIYGGTHTSRCFSDEFLSAVQRDTAIATERRFKSVKLASEDLFSYPFVIITGEAEFHFTAKEREHLKKYLESGGFLLASAGCSNKDWDRAFRREMKTLFAEKGLRPIEMDHPLFRTVHAITELKLHHPAAAARLEGIEVDGKLVVVYSPHGLNDTAHTEGCCCCGGNEITNSLQVNVNILVYALLY
ncbi:MAG TPA: DUF4159 domain-containing protein [Kiritimatiellia bacterium]|nr:DUF4159 domain-containing protein [Kiritimatiellia bacterium]HRZ12892.1 DUF4159 domain-containing protein [Kiritimatiellia bacterium]HSA18498.1 DUF4159 domain-containing protein [Kiritimatiellia bacterium]